MVIVAQYGCGCGCWTRGQKLALIRTVRLCVRTLISRSAAATKTGQAPTDPRKTAEVGHSQVWAQPWVMLAYKLLNRTGNGFQILYYQSVDSPIIQNWRLRAIYAILN